MTCAQLLAIVPLVGLAATVPAPPVESGTPVAACVLGGNTLVVADNTDTVWVAPIAGPGGPTPLPGRIGAWALAPAGPDSFWALTENGSQLVRLGLDGQLRERVGLRERGGDMAMSGDVLVLARMPFGAGGRLLWRGTPRALSPWAVEVDHGNLDPASVAIANAVAVATDGELTAVVRLVLRSELLLLDAQGHLLWTVTLPYYGERWAPLPFDPARLGRGEVAEVPRPYGDVAIAGGRVWCLSGQEGPWREGATRRGRHVVEIDRDGTIAAVHELAVDGCQLTADAEGILVVDRGLGVHRLPRMGRVQP